MRKRQSPDTPQDKSAKQKRDDIIKLKNTVPELRNIPANYFEDDTSGGGILGVGLLKDRPNVPYEYEEAITFKGKPFLKDLKKFSYFFVQYNNYNVIGIGNLQKSFAVIKTLNPTTIKDCSEMLGVNERSIKGITEDIYNNGTFYHPKYTNDNGSPLEFRYAEIAIIKQTIPGRLDNIPIGYPDFDSTPDGIVTRKGPLPTPPYTNFTTDTGATSFVTISAGGTVSFKDSSPQTPWTSAPTGWVWEFGLSANPTGSTAQNPIVAYGVTGSYTVTLTASNATGSTAKTKTNFVIVI